MTSGKHWGWALPGLLAAAACMAQPPHAGNGSVQKQLQHVRAQVQSQEAQARTLKQEIRQAKQRNQADQASLEQRDQEIARLKAQLASQQAKASKPAEAPKPAKHPKAAKASKPGQGH